MIRALAATTAAIWVATAAGAGLSAAGLALGRTVAEPHDALRAEPATALGLLAHNLPVALWPLALVAIGWPALAGVRALGDLLVGGQLMAHGAIVGAVVGDRPELWRYLPHLPLEWLGLAAPVAAWVHARTRGCASAQLVTASGISLAALAAAAVIETYLVPLT